MNQTNASKSMEKLSSGFRINRAGDDAAGLAISEKMRGQIRGLKQAQRNAQDGISLIQTAEGALNETHSILQRMRELAVQSATDTNRDEDRAEIQEEINQLAKEIDRIAETTQFNNMELLDGTFTGKVFHIGANSDQKVDLDISNMDAANLGVNGTAYSAQTFTGNIDVTSLTGQDITITLVASTENGNAAVTDTTAVFANGVVTVTLAQDAGESGSAGAITATWEDVLSALNTVAGEAGIVASEGTGYDGTTTASAATQTLTNWTEDPANSQVGINVSNQTAADSAVTVIDQAISQVSTERSKLGALQNRLEHTIANLGTSAENLQTAESRIRDLDMAEEIMAFTKNNILQQAATAMLAQANMAPQSVLLISHQWIRYEASPRTGSSQQ